MLLAIHDNEVPNNAKLYVFIYTSSACIMMYVYHIKEFVHFENMEQIFIFRQT